MEAVQMKVEGECEALKKEINPQNWHIRYMRKQISERFLLQNGFLLDELTTKESILLSNSEFFIKINMTTKNLLV